MATREDRNPDTITPIPVFTDNYAWVIQSGPEAVVVDPGEAGPIKQYINQHSLRLSALMVTHHHPDHCGGVDELKEFYGCPVIGPHDGRMAFVDDVIHDDEYRTVAGLQMRAIATPGHTRSHFVYFFPGLKALFSGDTLFSAGCGRLFEGSAGQLFASLRNCVSLGDDVLVYCGHEYTEENVRFAAIVDPGNAAVQNRMNEVKNFREKGLPTLPVTIAVEKATNPFLRTADSRIRERLGMSNASDVDVFAELRKRKDRF
jgi:hydroxyacylglutathione hydrolase